MLRLFVFVRAQVLLRHICLRRLLLYCVCKGGVQAFAKRVVQTCCFQSFGEGYFVLACVCKQFQVCRLCRIEIGCGFCVNFHCGQCAHSVADVVACIVKHNSRPVIVVTAYVCAVAVENRFKELLILVCRNTVLKFARAVSVAVSGLLEFVPLP